MDAQTELQKVSSRNSSLSNLSNVLYAIGVITIIAGVITFFVGIDYAGSWDDAKRLVSSSYITIGIGSVISGFCFFFFGAIGKAVNDIRNHAIADFNIRHSISEAVASEQSKEAVQSDKNGQEEVIFHNFQIGDEVIHIKFGTKMKIAGIHGNRITCDRGFLTGLATYNASELKSASGETEKS